MMKHLSSYHQNNIFQIPRYSLTPSSTMSVQMSATMSVQMSAMISPDRAASVPDLIADTVPSSSRAKRRQEEAEDIRDRIEPAAKVARLAKNAEEETKAQEGDTTPEILTTGHMMDFLKDLWSDDKAAIVRTMIEIADLGFRASYKYKENEVKMRVLGGHIALFQLMTKHVGCLGIQWEGMRALANCCRLEPTKKLLGDIGFVEVILARMNKYPESGNVQRLGCVTIAKLVRAMKDNAERVEKSGGIAVVIAAMKAHPNIAKLQDSGRRVLSRMSEWEEYRPLIVKAGGASAIAFIMEKDWEDPELCVRAYNVMERLAKKPR
jgi:hypothetical protein